MGKLIKPGDGRTMYESDGGTHRAAFKLNTSKGLSFKDPSQPVLITHSYRRTDTGWPPCNIGFEMRNNWEMDIMKLTQEDDQ